jgi:hypothetical protein
VRGEDCVTHCATFITAVVGGSALPFSRPRRSPLTSSPSVSAPGPQPRVRDCFDYQGSVNPAQVVDEATTLLSEPVGVGSQEGRGVSLAWWRSSSSTAAGPLGAIVVACLPKCPICWSAYLSSAGPTGVADSAYPRAQQLVAVLLVMHLASVLWQARATGQYVGLRCR